MSKSYNQKVTCPKCNHEQEVLIWESINTEGDSQLREALFKGEINQFTCEECNEKGFINTDLLYHDVKHKFSVQYIPPQDLEIPEFYFRFKPEFPVSLDIHIPEGMNHTVPDHLRQPHVVFEMNEMLHIIAFLEILLNENVEDKE